MTGRPRTSFFSRLARGCVFLLAIALAATRFDELHFMLDNLSNFLVHFAAMFFASAAILAISRDLRWAIVSVTGAAICLTPVVPWYFSGPSSPARPAPGAVKLLVLNVYLHNRQHARLVRLVQQERPDVIGLVEVNSRWLAELSSLRNEYTYRFELPDEHYFGLALYSRYPLINARILRVNETAPPAIAATMQLPAGEIEFILAHAIPPLNSELVGRRNTQLRDLGNYVSALERPVVVAGDLNVTMWNRNYHILAEQAGLQNARAGHGIEASWPAVRALGVPIDHILGTAPVQLRNFRVLAGIGSDHFPVSAEFSLIARGSGIRAGDPEDR